MFKNFFYLFMMMTFSVCLLCGCTVKKEGKEKIRNIEFTVLEEENIPEKCKELIEEKRDQAFQCTYEDGEYSYICVGYGKQDYAGYSIRVNDLYLGRNAIYVDTNLIGPSIEEQKVKKATYPYIVLKIEYLEEDIVFE